VRGGEVKIRREGGGRGGGEGGGEEGGGQSCLGGDVWARGVDVKVKGGEIEG
jgi:hypothetical protein